jgi:hypothetical protein
VHTTDQQKKTLVAMHRSGGFAFCPHKRETVDGDVTYGDTSFELDWLERTVPGWSIEGTDRSLEDVLQRYVYLSPSKAS